MTLKTETQAMASRHASTSGRFILIDADKFSTDINHISPYYGAHTQRGAVPSNRLLGFFRSVYDFLLPNRERLSPPPGSKILRIVDFLYSPATVEKVFTQIVADWRQEYFAALQSNRSWKGRWISCRYQWHILKAMGLSKVFSLLDRILPLSKQ